MKNTFELHLEEEIIENPHLIFGGDGDAPRGDETDEKNKTLQVRLKPLIA